MTQPVPEWAADLLAALELEPLEVRIETLHQIAKSIQDDPETDQLLTGFIAGYAAGMAQGSGMASFDRAHTGSVRFMRKYVAGE